MEDPETPSGAIYMIRQIVNAGTHTYRCTASRKYMREAVHILSQVGHTALQL